MSESLDKHATILTESSDPHEVLSGHYMAGAWIDTDSPLYLVRQFGQGENIVRNGDLVEQVISGAITQPDGPMWLAQERLDRLTKNQFAVLKKLKVEVKAIPVTVVRGAPKVKAEALILGGEE